MICISDLYDFGYLFIVILWVACLVCLLFCLFILFYGMLMFCFVMVWLVFGWLYLFCLCNLLLGCFCYCLCLVVLLFVWVILGWRWLCLDYWLLCYWLFVMIESVFCLVVWTLMLCVVMFDFGVVMFYCFCYDFVYDCWFTWEFLFVYVWFGVRCLFLLRLGLCWFSVCCCLLSACLELLRFMIACLLGLLVLFYLV